MSDMTPHIWMLVFALALVVMGGQGVLAWWHRHGLIAGVAAALRATAQPGHGASAEAIVMVIDKLRANEGSSVTIVADNADFNGQPDRLIGVTDKWTDWDVRYFGGDTLFEALADALKAKDAADV